MISLVLCELLMPVSIVCTEMLKLSRNNQNIKMLEILGVPPPPPEHSAIGNIQGYFVTGYYYITTCHSKQLPVGLEVFSVSDGMVHFLKIEKNFNKSTKTILWL